MTDKQKAAYYSDRVRDARAKRFYYLERVGMWPERNKHNDRHDALAARDGPSQAGAGFSGAEVTRS